MWPDIFDLFLNWTFCPWTAFRTGFFVSNSLPLLCAHYSHRAVYAPQNAFLLCFSVSFCTNFFVFFFFAFIMVVVVVVARTIFSQHWLVRCQLKIIKTARNAKTTFYRRRVCALSRPHTYIKRLVAVTVHSGVFDERKTISGCSRS